MSPKRPSGLLIFSALLAVTVSACTPAAPETGRPATEDTPPQSAEAINALSERDLAEARVVLDRHLGALSSNDTRVLLETTPAHRHGIYSQPSWPDQARSWAQLKVASVDTPGRYLDDESMRQVHREVFGRLPYQVAVFHVVIDRPFATPDTQEMDLDFVLIRASRDSDWLVYNEGR